MTSPSHGSIATPQMNPDVYGAPPGQQPAVQVPTQTDELMAIQLMRRQAQAIERLERIAFDKTHPVDEYISSPGVPNQNPIVLQPSYWMPERIESVLAYIPPSVTSALLQLGDRYIELAQFSPVASQSAFAAITPTTSFQNIATIPGASLPAGTYSVTVSTYLDGTIVAADDEDNFEVAFAGGTAIHLFQPAVADSVVNSGPFLMTTTGGNALQVKTASVTPSGTAVYHAVVTATQQQAPQSLSGLVVIENIGIILNQDDERFLTLTPLPTTGPVHIELMGYADEIYGNA